MEVRILGGDPELVYVDDADSPTTDAVDQALDARITLRLPESLKASLEATAAANGVSLNTWLVAALRHTHEPRPPVGGSRHRLTGYGQS